MRLRLLRVALLSLAIALTTAAPALADHSRHGGYHAPRSGVDHLRHSDDPRQRHHRPFLRDHRAPLRHHRSPFLQDHRDLRRHGSPFLRGNRGQPSHYSRPFLRSKPFLRDDRHPRGDFRSGRHLAPRAIVPRRPLHLPNQHRYRAPSRHGPSLRIRID